VARLQFRKNANHSKDLFQNVTLHEESHLILDCHVHFGWFKTEHLQYQCNYIVYCRIQIVYYGQGRKAKIEHLISQVFVPNSSG